MKPAAGPSILAAALIVAFVWLALLRPARALADELPNDTNQIERLTPEQAKKLAAEFPGVRVWRFSCVSRRPRPSRPFPGLRRLASGSGQRLWMSITGNSSGEA